MDITFSFIGWCNKTDRDGSKHDKVWVAFEVADRYYAGWGARGKKLTFKDYGTKWKARDDQSKVRRKKDAAEGGDYTEVDAFQLFAIFPNFQDELEARLVFCTLANKIK